MSALDIIGSLFQHSFMMPCHALIYMLNYAMTEMICFAIAMLEACFDMPCYCHVSRCYDFVHA